MNREGRFRRFLVDPVARWASVVGCLLALVTLVGPTVGLVPVWAYAVGYMTFAAAITSLAFYNMVRRRHLEVEVEQWKGRTREKTERCSRLRKDLRLRQGAFQVLHDIAHEARDHMSEVFRRPVPIAQQRDRLYWRLGVMVDKVARTLTGFTGVPCASCIKIFTKTLSPDGSPKLMTFCRDDASKHGRGKKDRQETFTVEGNYDFDYILNSAGRYFFSNDLIASEAAGEYWNERPGWAKYYRAAMVLPIQRSWIPGDRENFHDILGFLCVDTEKTNILDENELFGFLATVADTMYLPLSMVVPLEEEGTQWQRK